VYISSSCCVHLLLAGHLRSLAGHFLHSLMAGRSPAGTDGSRVSAGKSPEPLLYGAPAAAATNQAKT
ncbi:hypothetical protein M9458_046831, partial [Cirrhinus mrigala]